MSKTEDQSSFTAASSTFTPNKIRNGQCFHSSSTDSRHSMTPLDTSLCGSFSYPGPTGMGHGSITPVTSVVRSQWVASSTWQPPGLFFPTLPPATDTLSAGQVAEIYQLATECQDLGMELTKQFQNLFRLEAMHHTMAQAMAHETRNAGCMACIAAFSAITANESDVDCKKFLHQSCAEANQAWKDMNDVIFSHQLEYDAQLAAFITTVEGTFQAKWDEIWSCIHSITEVAGLPYKACLTLALQILDKLPTLPLDLFYCTAIPRMLAYCPESYAFQAWSAMGDGDYLLDNNAWATSMLSLKLMCMAGGANLDGPCLSGAASPGGSAGSAMLCSPVPSPSHSCSRTLAKGGGGRSQSSSTSSLFSQGIQPESPAASNPNAGSSGSSASEDDSESDGEGEAGSDDGASDSSGSSDDESSSSSESGSEEASDDEGTQQDGLDNEDEGSGSETERSDAGGGNSPSKSDHAESPPKASQPAKKAPEVNLNTSQMLSLPDLDSMDLEEEWKIKQHPGQRPASGGTKRLVRASDNGMSMTK